MRSISRTAPVRSPPVSASLFDRKFGASRLDELPRAPGVYLFRYAEGRVLYVGKAKRLAGHRNASRRKGATKHEAVARRRVMGSEIAPSGALASPRTRTQPLAPASRSSHGSRK
jgi:hypothetical protein